MKPLGKTQQSFLEALRRHQRWYSMCGWIWTSESKTRQLAESLTHRGLVTKTTERMRWNNSYVERDVYRPL